MPDLITLDEALDAAADASSLLLGNGFSIACDDSFRYDRLLDEATFGDGDDHDRARAVFESEETADFERIVRHLQGLVRTLPHYPGTEATVGLVNRDADAVKDALADAISQIHPARIGDVGEERLDTTSAFLKRFSSVFTLNYDLLLYWTILRDRNAFDDGFRRRDQGLTYVQPTGQSIYYLHGALHLHQEAVRGASPITTKGEWGGGTPLVEQVKSDLNADRFPLIVMEGTWEQKQTAVESSPYLRSAFDALRGLEGSLFTYGWSLDDNDSHVLGALEASRVTELFVGIYGDLGNDANAEIAGRSTSLAARANDRIDVKFWDVTTADVW